MASLSHYNRGRLWGRWIDAAQEPERLLADIDEMLAGSADPLAEEWAIHDFLDFGPWGPSEYESIDTISRIACGIAEHGEAFAHYVQLVGTNTEGLDDFADVYLGHWRNLREYAESLIEDYGVDDAIAAANLPLENYVRVDVDLLERDLDIELYSATGADGVHLFSPR